jgi:hypothetical protein
MMSDNTSGTNTHTTVNKRSGTVTQQGSSHVARLFSYVEFKKLAGTIMICR